MNSKIARHYPRRQYQTPIKAADLRLLQELEMLRFGHSLGGAYTETRKLGR